MKPTGNPVHSRLSKADGREHVDSVQLDAKILTQAYPVQEREAALISRAMGGMSGELLNEEQAAKYLTVTRGTLSVWRSTGRYNLPFVKVGRMVRYRRGDLDAWLDARSRDTGATA